MEEGKASGLIYMPDLIKDPKGTHRIDQKYMVIEDSVQKNLVFAHTDMIAKGMVVEFERIKGQDGKDDYAVDVRPKEEEGTADGQYTGERVSDPRPDGRSGLDLGYYQLKDSNGDVIPYIRHEEFPRGTKLTFNRILGDALFNLKDSAINVRA